MSYYNSRFGFVRFVLTKIKAPYRIATELLVPYDGHQKYVEVIATQKSREGTEQDLAQNRIGRN